MNVQHESNPRSRFDWALLEWRDAQHEVAKLLNRYGFMIFEEKNIGDHKRSDVIVYRQTQEEFIVGIVEVKTYKKITPSMVKRSLKQACKYMQMLYQTVNSNRRWGNKLKRYFIATVFTNDYPASFSNYTASKFVNILPKRMITEDECRIFTTTPNNLIEQLQRFNLVSGFQKKIDDFF